MPHAERETESTSFLQPQAPRRTGSRVGQNRGPGCGAWGSAACLAPQPRAVMAGRRARTPFLELVAGQALAARIQHRGPDSSQSALPAEPRVEQKPLPPRPSLSREALATQALRCMATPALAGSPTLGTGGPSTALRLPAGRIPFSSLETFHSEPAPLPSFLSALPPLSPSPLATPPRNRRKINKEVETEETPTAWM